MFQHPEGMSKCPESKKWKVSNYTRVGTNTNKSRRGLHKIRCRCGEVGALQCSRCELMELGIKAEKGTLYRSDIVEDKYEELSISVPVGTLEKLRDVAVEEEYVFKHLVENILKEWMEKKKAGDK